MLKLLLLNKNSKSEFFENKSVGIGYYESPIGLIKISSNKKGITGLGFVDTFFDEIHNEYIKESQKQLKEYFDKKRTEFDIPVCLFGTDFQLRVWEKLTTIDYSKTATYKDIASLLGDSKATRAVGGANNKNPIAIIIPCHRIIGSSGKLVGYAGGMEKKQWLLNHERNT